MESNSPLFRQSRDPRLNRGPLPPPIRTTSQDSGFAAPSGNIVPGKGHDESFGDLFVQGIMDLAQNAAISACMQAEKDKLKKARDNMQPLLQKAQAMTNFPSTIASFEQASKLQNANLKDAESALAERQARLQQLQRTVKNNYASLTSFGAPHLDDIAKLQNEVKVANTMANEARIQVKANNQDVTKTNDEISTLSDCNKSLREEIRALKGKIEDRNMETTHQLERLSSEWQRVRSEAAGADQANTRLHEQHLCKLRDEIQGIAAKVEKLGNSQGALSTTITALDPILKKHEIMLDEHEKLMDQTSVRYLLTLGEQLKEFRERLSSVEVSIKARESVPRIPTPTKPEGPRIQNTNPGFNPDKLNASDSTFLSHIHRLDDRLNRLAQIHQDKDDELFGRMEKSEKDIKENAEFVRKSCGDVSQKLNSMMLSNPVTAIQGLSVQVGNMEPVLEAVKIGLQSLEHRYNNLSTEPIVKNMVIAWQELYPTATQLMEQTSTLKRYVEQEISLLNTRVETSAQVHQNKDIDLNQMKEDICQHKGELDRLKSDHTSLTQSLDPVWDHLSQDVYRQNEFRTLQGKFDSLSDTSRDLKSRFEGMEARLSDDDVEGIKRLKQDLQDTSHDLISRFQGMEARLIDADVEGIKKLKQDVQDTSRDLLSRFESIEARLRDADVEGIQQLKQDVQTVRDNVEKFWEHYKDVPEILAGMDKRLSGFNYAHAPNTATVKPPGNDIESLLKMWDENQEKTTKTDKELERQFDAVQATESHRNGNSAVTIPTESNGNVFEIANVLSCSNNSVSSRSVSTTSDQSVSKVKNLTEAVHAFDLPRNSAPSLHMQKGRSRERSRQSSAVRRSPSVLASSTCQNPQDVPGRSKRAKRSLAEGGLSVPSPSSPSASPGELCAPRKKFKKSIIKEDPGRRSSNLGLSPVISAEGTSVDDRDATPMSSSATSAKRKKKQRTKGKAQKQQTKVPRKEKPIVVDDDK